MFTQLHAQRQGALYIIWKIGYAFGTRTRVVFGVRPGERPLVLAEMTGVSVVQPALTGLDEIAPLTSPPAAAPAPSDAPADSLSERAVRRRTDSIERLAAADRRARRRYWSVRDLSRRLWLGRGYELLRELI